ncbi:MAG: hypothetical protein Q9M16_01880 [Mariprofundus sp.]|nr:hypothetical protein [Mariprofundus sp.]
MFKAMFKLLFAALCLLAVQPFAFAADARMQVDVVAKTEQVEVSWLHANVRKAAALALPQLWQRIVPRSAHGLIPKRLKAIQFLEKASPTASGMRISFHQQRVMNFLKKHKIPYIAQQPALNIVLQVYNQAGQAMGQTANALLANASHLAKPLGYRMDDRGASLVLLWRWLDKQGVSLNLRGNSKLKEFSETRRLRAGDPLKQLQPWLHEVLLKARDAYVEQATTPVESVQAEAGTGTALAPAGQGGQQGMTGLPAQGLASAAVIAAGFNTPPVAVTHSPLTLILRVQRQASLADQVQLEDELQQDPRILNLSLRQVNQQGQQYRLQLKGSDDQWLTAWFAHRGMTLTPTIEGWVAH